MKKVIKFTPQMQKHFYKEDGFTLIEVILAVGILAAIGVLTINVLTNQIEMRSKITELDNSRHLIDRAMSRVYNDLKSAYVSPIDYVNSLNLNKRQVKPQFYMKTNNLVFSIQSYKSYLRNSNQSNLAFVRYFTRKNPNNRDQQQLIRVVDTDMASSIELKNVGYSQVLVDDLKEFKVQFWTGDSYRDDWDSQSLEMQEMLPKLVKIHLSVYFPENTSLKNQPTDKEQKKSIDLDTIVYLNNAAGQNETNTSTWSEYKWQ